MKYSPHSLLLSLAVVAAPQIAAADPNCSGAIGHSAHAQACSPGDKTVYISVFQAQPDQLTVPAGTTVTWANHDQMSHDISFDGQAGDRIWAKAWQGASYSRSFDQPGEYPYRCSIHKDVNGKVIVTGSTLQTSAVSPQQSAPVANKTASAPTTAGSMAKVVIDRHAFAPGQLRVKAGEAVTWTNADRSNHVLVFSDQQSSLLPKGATFQRQFEQAGEYAYHCGIHGYMSGTVTVDAR